MPALHIPMINVGLTVAAMLSQQALATMAALTIPVLAPPIGAELGLNPGLIGAYTAVLYGMAMLSALGAGGLVLRYGAVRISQICLLACAAGLAVSAPGSLALFALAGLLIGFGTGPSTPASSHLIARYAPPRIAPLVFSIKQTGVPIGNALAGALLPAFVALMGWRGALFATACLCAVLVVLLQAIRFRFDSDRQPGRPLAFGDVAGTLKAVIAHPALRELAYGSFVFAGLQVSYGAFLVAYLADGLGFELAVAGFVLAASQSAAVVGRIFWGWIGSRFIHPRHLLGVLGITMAAGAIAVGLFSASWPFALIMAIGIAFGLTGISYQGVLLSEIARQSPPGQVGLMTGGVLFFTFGGLMVLPAGFGAILGWTGSYSYAFFATAVPALIAGLLFFRPLKEEAGAVRKTQ